MSYRLCLFAVTADVELDLLVGTFAELADELRRENDYTAVYLATSSDAAARAEGLRWLYLAVEPASEGRVGRGFFIDRWTGPPLFIAIHDDQHGIYAWQRVWKGRTESILSDGPIVGTSNVALTVSFPQRGLTREQLDSMAQKPWEQRTDAERRLSEEWATALEIGLRQFGFSTPGRRYLAVLDAAEAWSLLDRPPRLRDLPDTAGPVVDSYVELYEFMSHGLPKREY
jgi:hypothetical protein